MEFIALEHLFWAFPLLLLAIGAAYWAYSQRRRAIALLTQNAEQCQLKSNAHPIRRRIKAITLACALIFALIAVLRPIGGKEVSETRRPAKNILVVLDLSTSMTVADSDGIARIDAAKLLLRELIDKRPTDKIGILSFASDTFIESPITLGRSILLQKLEKAQPGDFLQGGTDIDLALREAQALLTDTPPPGSAIVVLSDGDNVTGRDPKEILNTLKKQNIPVIGVAFGQNGVPVTVPETNITTAGNHDTLKALATSTNGLFVAASPNEVDSQIAKINERIDTIELDGEDITTELYERPLDLYTWPLAIALISLMIHIFLPLRGKSWHPLTTAIALLLALSQTLPAEEVSSYEEAIELAKKDDLPALLIFTGSDWSKLSITFEREILNHQVFQKWAESKVVHTTIDLPQIGITDDTRAERRALAEKFSVETYPLAVFLDANENILGTLTHDPEGPSSWIKRADAIIAGEKAQSDTAATAEFLPEAARKSLEDPEITEAERSVRYYNKALELEKAEPELALESKDRFALLLDLYQKAGGFAPSDRPNLRLAALHKQALLHHEKGRSLTPKSEAEIMALSLKTQLDPIALLKAAKDELDAAVRIYRKTVPLKANDEELSTNIALAYQNRNRVQAYLDYFESYQAAVTTTVLALAQEKRFAKSLEREVTTSLNVNQDDIQASVEAIQELVENAEAIQDEPTILPEKGLKDYQDAEEDVVLAPDPHLARELKKAQGHLQDALDHLIDPQQMQAQPQQGEQEGEGGGEQEGEGEGGEQEGEGQGGRQRNREGRGQGEGEEDNPQGDRPGGKTPGRGNEDEEPDGEGGGGGTTDSDLRRAEKENGDLRQRLMNRRNGQQLRNGRRIPRSKSH